MAQLIVVEGTGRGQILELEGKLLIGSAENADLRLHDRRASAEQIEVSCRDGAFEIKNLDARVNLLVNGEIVRRRRRLSHGDWISIADTTLVFSDDVPRERRAIELSLQTDDLFASRIAHRRPQFDSAESVLESIDDDAVVGSQAKAADRLAMLYRVSTAISSHLHLPALLDSILQICFDVFPAERGFILLLDDDDRRLKCVASKVKSPDRAKEASATDISKTIVREVFQQREAVLSLDASNDERFHAGQSLVGGSMKSVMCAPFVREDRVIGVLQVDTAREANAFTGGDLELLSAIAMQCAVAIENARAYKKRQEFSRSLIYLARATQRLSSFLDRDHIVKEAVKSACALLSCTKGSLVIRRDDDRLRLVSAVGLPRDLKDQLAEDEVGERFVRRVIESGQPSLVADLRQHSIAADGIVDLRERYSSRSFLIVPIFSAAEAIESRGTAIGAISVTDKLSKGTFNGNDQEVLQVLASQAGIALANAELYEKATIDTLTRVYVRRYFFQKLEVEVQNAHYTERPLMVLMIDLDHFKSVNDTYGHAAGDAVLRTLGKLLRQVVRAGMTCARYGGEEFSIICPGVTEEVAVKVGERIRVAIEAQAFPIQDGRVLHKTASIGAAVLCPGETFDALIERADQALYASKDGGRNRVTLAPPA